MMIKFIILTPVVIFLLACIYMWWKINKWILMSAILLFLIVTFGAV